MELVDFAQIIWKRPDGLAEHDESVIDGWVSGILISATYFQLRIMFNLLTGRRD